MHVNLSKVNINDCDCCTDLSSMINVQYVDLRNNDLPLRANEKEISYLFQIANWDILMMNTNATMSTSPLGIKGNYVIHQSYFIPLIQS